MELFSDTFQLIDYGRGNVYLSYRRFTTATHSFQVEEKKETN